MSLQIKTLLWLASVGVVFGCLFAAYEHGVSVTNDQRDKDVLEERLQYAEAFADAQSANDKLKTDGAKQHAKDTATTERVRADFSAYRLRMPKAKNCNGDGDSNSASGSMDGTTGGGLRPDSEQAAFDRFTDGLKQDSYRLDTLIDSCRVVMSWARNLCKLNNTCGDDK